MGAQPSWKARLAELDLALPEVVAPLASYVPAVRTGDLVYTAGQLPMRAGKLAGTGKLGAEVTRTRARRWRGSARSTRWRRSIPWWASTR